ncbi:MAG: hypothetical protein ACXWEY_08580 [Bacteroidia bacterium]
MKLFAKSKETDFKFNEPENTACFVCDHVMNLERPILYATHDFDEGEWQFLCGQTDHTTKSIRIISLKNAAKIDNSINDLFEMPIGVGAERKSIESEWKPFKLRKDNSDN